MPGYRLNWKAYRRGRVTTLAFKLDYRGSPLIGTPLLPKNSVLIREVSFGEREHYMHSQYLLPGICVIEPVTKDHLS